ncbi:DNA fragmentation factor subunit beta-like [Bufo gargarizans]|uniref:DNA fragmentation factor subunit beta-like n=1 Tax=Bufo gargarizans TaxID=30331 RepID=UPI001CF22127|nr:DNA fragmentation factor subunit beta-like [Bufo gargarizans]
MGSHSSTQKHMKIFKIRTLQGSSKYGIGCRNLRELLEKGCKKFQLPLKSARVCLYEDGTELSDEYLRNLPDNTELVFLTPGQTWDGFVTDIGRLLNAFYTRQTDVTEAARKLLTDEQAPQRRKILVDFIQNLNENILAENREDDKSWFEGIEPRYKNKSSYMRNSCESRVRSYMKEVQSLAATLDPPVREDYKMLTETMCNELRAVKYNGCYFDRTEEKTSRLCTAEGWFSCQGPFDVDDCSSRHSINPYSNKESRILFSTWNLDHRIEKKRTILPRLTEALGECNGRQINWKYFFNLLFTVENLKLVHIACHKKTAHNLTCDDAMIYIKRKPVRKTKN